MLMKVPVYSLEGREKGSVGLGRVFSLEVREDIIRRAFLSEARRQPYGANPLAGKRTSAHYHGKRHYRWSMMNREMARMKRIHGQGFLNYTARFVPQATKGRKAHPPKTEKKWERKINRKERMLALLSALAATANKEYLQSRGHAPLPEMPIVLEDRFQELKKTSDVISVLEKLGLGGEIKAKKKIRAGRGKSRGRKYRRRKGPLIIVTGKRPPSPPGMDVKTLQDIAVSDLAPGGKAGRLTIWTESSIKAADRMGS
jgi:large subunit ribosomal protein L4e